jgi:hypothetical protein
VSAVEADVQSEQVCPAITVPSAFDPVSVVLDRRRRSGPLPVDSLAVFFNEHRHIAFPCVELGEIVRHHHLVRISPRPAPMRSRAWVG